MYKILLDNTLMFDSRIEELALINPVVKLEENKAGSFSFTITSNHPRYNDINRRKSLIQVYQDEISDTNLLFSGICIEVNVDFYKQKSVYCEGEMTYLNDSIQRPAKYQGVTVRGLLETYINNHNAQVESEKQFTVGMVTVTDPNNSLYCFSNMETTMQCLKDDLVDDLGGYMRIRHQNGVKYIDYLKDSMNTNGQVIRLGENLIDFTSNIDSSEIATAIIPQGARLETSAIEGLETRLDIKSVNNNIDYVYNANAVTNFGWIYKTVTWDDVTVASNLKQKGEKYLSEIQFENMVIEAKALDLNLIDKSMERFKLSDKIRVVSNPHGLNKYFRLTKQTIDLTNPENDTITLGKEEKVSLSAKTSQVNEVIMKAMESIVPTSDILKQAKKNATALINGNGTNGYVVFHENENGVVYEILVMDTNNINTATKMWRWNENGLGYRQKNEQDEWDDYSVAMTMDGAIEASFITSGNLSSDVMKTSVISAINDDSNAGSTINDGRLNIESTTIFKKINGNDTDTTEIDGGKIKASSIDADRMNVGSLSAISATLGSVDVGGADNGNGSISVKDSSDSEVVTIDAKGIDMKSGSIALGDDGTDEHNPTFSVDDDGNMTASSGSIGNKYGDVGISLEDGRVRFFKDGTERSWIIGASSFNSTGAPFTGIVCKDNLVIKSPKIHWGATCNETDSYDADPAHTDLVYAGRTGEVTFITDIRDNGDGTISWTWTTYNFVNGILT